MEIDKLIEILQATKRNTGIKKVFVASDEEWNTIFQDIEVEEDKERKALVIFGFSGSEVE